VTALAQGCAVDLPPLPGSDAAEARRREAAEAREREAVYDALPRFYDASEVDEPAAPVAPIEPVYPPLARRRGLEGNVTFAIAVRADGALAGVRRLASDGADFARAAEEAVRAARFAPARRGGEPVNSTFVLLVRFRLDE